MNKLKNVFSAIICTFGLVATSIAQAETIKIGVSFRMLSDVGYKHGELITDTVAKWNKEGTINGQKIDLTLYNDECKIGRAHV